MQSGDHEVICRMLLEGNCDLGVTASAPNDARLRNELLYTDDVIAVAAPSVVKRLASASNFQDALAAEPLLAYNLELPLVDSWLSINKIEMQSSMPAMVGQDLRALRSLLIDGFGWTTLPSYLCKSHIQRGELQEIPAPVGHARREYHLVWTPSALRQPRVAHARQALLWYLRENRQPPAKK